MFLSTPQLQSAFKVRVCVCVCVPQAQVSVVGHGVLQPLQDDSMLGLWQTAQVKGDHLQSKHTFPRTADTHTGC